MRNSILTAALIGSAIVGGIIGGNINEIRRNAETQEAWSQVKVVSGGTLVANPAYYADHPEELSNVTIIDPMDHITICTDRSGDVFVNPKDSECQDFKEIQFASK